MQIPDVWQYSNYPSTTLLISKVKKILYFIWRIKVNIVLLNLLNVLSAETFLVQDLKKTTKHS